MPEPSAEDELAARAVVRALLQEAKYQTSLSRSLAAMGPTVIGIIRDVAEGAQAVRRARVGAKEWENRA